MAEVAAAAAGSTAGAAMRVQSISQSGQSRVPPQYVQPVQTRPGNRAPGFDNIPSVDLSEFNPASRDRVREEIGPACRDWGAFHVIGHGVPPALLERVRAVGRAFFEEFPMEEKVKYACDASSAATEGYGSRMLENDDVVLDWRDYFDHHSLPLSRRNPSRWPHHPPDYRQVVAEYSDQMALLASKLLGLISESLGLPTSCIEDSVGEFYQNITISFYPPCPQPDLTLGLQAHSDMGAVTLLIQDDVGGLQVLKDGEWVMVQPVTDAIVVILADQTEECRTSGHNKR
ncbi:leucoanthocyanidin dioxygenase isoform X2 [Punica granatum]|uniref:Leucoanthocyanidin dioxygenase isoform X2 n=1 Tax=Punica granatum TaxID=22663 RepID=A0A6P8C541_PUNGR|nr:leucoanthocyanidin dioxygenase isoform X2 [Punica granatum]